MRKNLACSILIVTSSLVACGKDKHQEPAMAPAAGEQWEQRPQTAPTAPAEPETQAPSEWQDPSGMGEQPTDPWAAPAQGASLDAQMLAETRCRRELRCDRIGDDKKYPTVEECEAKLLADGNEALSSCAQGVSREALTTCVTAIQAKGCDSSMDKLTEYEQCRTTMLCAP